MYKLPRSLVLDGYVDGDVDADEDTWPSSLHNMNKFSPLRCDL
jgi:hypothetical protein